MIVLECDKVFTAKASRNRHVWKDYHKYDAQGSPIQTVRFVCIAQKVYEKVNLICKFCGHGDKDGGPFIGRHRTAQHSLGRTCTMRIFHYQKQEWYPGPLLEPTEENIEMLIRESHVYVCLRTKFETFFKQGERNTRKRKQAGVQPATLNKAEKRRTDGRGFFIKDINAVRPDPRTPPKKIVRLSLQRQTVTETVTTETVTPPYSDTTLFDTTLFDTTGSDTTLFDTTGTDTTLFGTTGSDTTLFGTNAQSGKCSSF